MRIETVTGLRGELIAYHAPTQLAVVLRDDATFADRPYSTHFIFEITANELGATGGRYDLTEDQAMAEFGALFAPTASA